MSLAHPQTIDEHELYPVHEEDSVPETIEHERHVWALRSALRLRFPDLGVTGDVCMYWEREAYHLYRAPDVLVVAEAFPEEQPVYLAWRDPKPLLVIEVGSRSTLRADEGPKIDLYLRNLAAGECLYFKPHRTARWRSLQLWRLEQGEVVTVRPNGAGRLASRELPIEFGLDEEGQIQLFELSGRRLPLPQDVQAEAIAQRARADAAQALASAEKARADSLEAELARLREQVKRLGGSAPEA
jgi:Uma2 family endonuclease